MTHFIQFLKEIIDFDEQRFVAAISGSFRAVITSWLWGAAPWVLMLVIGYFYALLYMAPYVFCTWLFVCLPLYYRTPARSFLWNKWVCMTCGAICGPLMLWFIPMLVTTWIPSAHVIFASSLYTPPANELHQWNATQNGWPSGSGMQPLAILTAALTGIIACRNACKHHTNYIRE